MEIYFLWVIENLRNNLFLATFSYTSQFLDSIFSIQIPFKDIISRTGHLSLKSIKLNWLCYPILVVLLSLMSSLIARNLLRYIPLKYFDKKEINIKYHYLFYTYLSLGFIFAFPINNVMNLLLLFLFLNMAIPLLIIDFKIGYLPNILTYPLLWFGFLYQMACPSGNIISAIYAVVLSFIMMVGITAVVEKIKKRPQMGRGDFKLIAACSAWIGILQLPYFLGFAAALGLIHMGALYLKSENRVSMSIPFGPAIILSASFWLYQSIN